MVEFTQRIAAATSVALGPMLSEALDTAIAAHAKADYEAHRGSGTGDVAAKRIGSGYIGTECDRELGFRYHKHPKEDREGPVNKGELQRHAESGHWAEAMVVKWFAMAGIHIETCVRDKETGAPLIDPFGKPKQIGWKAARDPETGQYRMAGEVDGVILAVPAAFAAHLKPETIWENKKATDKKWKKFQKEGVKGADPRYYGQLQTNMAYLNAEQTLFSMLNLDTMKFYFEIVPFDQAAAQKLSDRAVRVMQSATAFDMAQIGRSEDDFKCKFCDYQGQCWKGLVLKAPEPTQAQLQRAIAGQEPKSVTTETIKRPIFNPNFKVANGR